MKLLFRVIIPLIVTLALLAACVLFLHQNGFFEEFSAFYDMVTSEDSPFSALFEYWKQQKNPPSGGGGSPYDPSNPVAPGDAALEEVLADAILALEEDVNVTQFGLTDAEIREQMEHFFFTHPQFFYVSTGYQIQTVVGSDVISQVRLRYLYDKAEIPAMIAEYENAVQAIVDTIPEDGTEFDTVLYLHDYLVQHYSYDYRQVSEEDRIRDAYRFFKDGTGVCQAYMLAFIALCEEAHIECLPVTSTEMDHAWNLVKVDGAWYHVDITWDDAGGETAPVYPSYISYKYFLVSGEALWSLGREVEWKATEVAEDTRFDAALWHNANTPMISHGDKYYCAFYDEEQGTVLCSGTAETMEIVKVLNGVRWEAPTGLYRAAWVGLCSFGDVIVFNTATTLCTYDPATGLTRQIADLSGEIGARMIFGFNGFDAATSTLTCVVAINYRGTYEEYQYKLQ